MINEQLDKQIKEIFKLYDEEDDYNWTLKYGETPYWEVVKNLIKEEKIKELELVNSHYNLKDGNVLLYERDGKNVYLGDRIKELKESV